MNKHVVLVNETDEVLGKMEKIEAHEKGLLHRAISILLFNDEGKMLIQQRASTKYHWPSIWSNAVCSHPKWQESYSDAAKRRLTEELGITVPLEEMFRFIYKAKDPSTQLIEHELDAVFTGVYNGPIPFNKNEIDAVKWMSKKELLQAIEERPETFSFWFKVILDKAQKENKIPQFM